MRGAFLFVSTEFLLTVKPYSLLVKKSIRIPNSFFRKQTFLS